MGKTGGFNGKRPGLLVGRSDPEAYGLGTDFVMRGWQNEAFIQYRRKVRETGGRFSFLLQAGVGSGKTLWTAMVAAHMLGSSKKADLVFYVCPNRAIRRRVQVEYRKANIHLARWNKGKADRGIPAGVNGYIATYQAAMRDHKEIGEVCDLNKVFVVFDEIHHLGESLSWHDAAKKAFEGRAWYILGVTGTPFRSDNRKIPFVRYFERPGGDGILSFDPDYSYPLGRAIADGHCRKPIARWLEADVRVKFPDGHVEVVDMDAKLDVPMMNRRLNGAVRAGENNLARAKALAYVIGECRRRKDRIIIFVGGDSSREDGGGVKDATEYLPNDLAKLGVLPHEMTVVVSKDNLSAEKIEEFGKSDAWILICVNMVSEGVDIPELTAALFLTSITARSTTIQRIGRVLRGQGEAYIYMFKDPRYREVIEGIEAEYRDEIALGRGPSSVEPYDGDGVQDRDDAPPSLGVDSRPGGITVGGVHYLESEVTLCRRYITDKNFPEGLAFLSTLLPLARDGVLNKYKS